MKAKYILILASALAVFAACKKSEEVEPSKVSLKPGTISVSANGDTKTLAISANGDWTATSSEGWVHIAPTSGSAATKSIMVQVDENGTGQPRTAVITVKCGTAKDEATVSQSAEASSEGTIASADDMLDFIREGAFAATDADEFNIIADIDLGGAEIAPISSFAGILDGNNHKVYNYKVVSSASTSGLFLMNTGTISNLILGSSDGSTYDGKSEVGFDGSVTTYHHIGGVCANNAGTIENVKQFAKVVTHVGNTELTGIGGLVGAIISPATVKGCENHATIEADGITAGETYIGGVVAYVNNADALVDHCVNAVPIEATIGINKASMFAGVVARANLGAKVVDCENLAPVKYVWSDQGQSGNYIMVAGVVGSLYTGSSAIRCVNKAEVSSTNQQVTRMGGVVGTLNSKGLVEECVNEGEINLTVANPNVNWQSVAGVVGFQEKQNSENIIRNNINKADVNVNVNITGTHASNRVHVGGILGLGNLGVEIYGNKNQGNITATNTAAPSGNATQIEAGGIVGGIRGEGSYTRDNENSGMVSCSAGDYAFTGGIAGHLGTLAGASDDALLTMDNDKNTGAVVGSDATKTGSVAGVSTATITGCTAAGSVNGVTLTDDNFVQLAVGTNTGKIVDLKSPSGSTATIKELAVSPAENRVSAETVSASFTVTSNTSWTVSTAADWITSYTTSGANDGTIEIAFAAYTDKDADREAEFTVSGEGVAAPVVVKLIQSKVLDNAPHNIPSAAEFILFLTALKAETPDLARWQDNDGVIELAADINFEGTVLEPGTAFEGVLDGKNHKIYNFKVASKENNSGLILTNKGTIKNLIVGSSDGTAYDGTSEVGFDASAAKNNHVGGICAYNAGTIKNVKQFATVVSSGTNGETSGIGGIAGSSIVDESLFEDCHNYAQLSVGNTVSETYIGGIVGNVANAVTITNCSNEVALVLSIINTKAVCFGGLIGRTNLGSTISYCTNNGTVSYVQPDATGGNFIHIGGVAGAIYNNSSMTYCANKAKVSSNRLQVSRIGGVLGTLNKGGLVEHCTNDAPVELIHSAENGNWQSAGGIVGFQEAVDKPNYIRNNTNNGSVTVSVSNATTHANKVSAGGIIGLATNAIEISGNTNKGAVSLTNASTGLVNAGGIIGWMKHASCATSGNVNSGSVSASTSDNASVTAGGVAGCLEYEATSCTGDKNTGAVACENAGNTGSVAGLNKGALSNCIAGGSVNSVALTAENLASLTQGSASTGTATGTTLAE